MPRLNLSCAHSRRRGILMRGVIKRVLLSWSSGKDSAWALQKLRQQSDVDLDGLLTTINEQYDRVPMQAVRTDMLRRLEESLGLTLRLINMTFTLDNETYEA